jgi:DMSO/TMAO reductase YedYZ molybdopterin-dependent catalytic subunit
VIQICGAVAAPAAVPVTDLASLPRTDRTADFHCVAGWSATDLHWEGVAFAEFYRSVIAPAVTAPITHVVFGGLDGFESVLLIDDAMASDVLIADRLNGRPLDTDHGAPARLVSPSQYGYMNTKHLCRIELLTAAPTRELGSAHPISRVGLRGPLVLRHPRARVWSEERHPYLSARRLRPLYRLVIPLGVWLGARASRRSETS